MKIFTNKNLIQKIIIVFLCVFLLNFCITPSVQALTYGSLFSPIKQLITAVADIFITLVQWGMTGNWISAVDDTLGAVNLSNNEVWDDGLAGLRQFDYPIIQISPELIFGNKIRLLDIDFIGNNNDDYIQESGNKIIVGDGDVVSALRTIIASWYVTLRTIAIVGSLSVLIYIGIRIMISSTAADKAKYKQMILDWIIAFCILLFMHYIMAGTINIVNRINKLLGDAGHIGEGISLNETYGTVQYNGALQSSSLNDQDEKIQIVKDYLTEIGYFLEDGTPEASNPEGNLGTYGVVDSIWYFYGVTDEKEEDKHKYIITLRWDQTANLGQYSLVRYHGLTAPQLNGDQIKELNNRLQRANINDTDGDDGNFGETTTSNNKHIYVSTDSSKVLYYINYARLYVNLYDAGESFGFIILYIILIVLTTMFAIRYMKRVIYVAFLTLIAPLVALTYPIDKIKDGQAQAFNMWFREYIFNVLIQPFHLLIYSVLVGSAMELANEHMIYAIVTIGFLIPAEKLLRKFFGFDKAGTLSAAGSFAGGAIFSSVLNKINRPKSGGKGGSGKDGGASQGVRKPNPPKDFDAKSTVFDMMADGETQSNNSSNSINSSNNRNPSRGGAESREGNGAADNRGELNQTEAGSDSESGTNDRIEELTKKVFADGSKWDLAKKGFGQRLRNGAYMGGYRLKRKIANGARTLPKSAGRLIRRAAIGGLVGGTLGTVGLAIGAASGDLSKAFQYAAAGGVAGYYGANHYGDKLAKSVGEDFQSSKVAFWGSNIKQVEQDKFDKEFLANADNREKLLRALGSPEEVERVINDGSVQAFLSTGYTDAGKIGKALGLLKQGKIKSLDQAVAIANWERDIGPAIFDPTSEHRRSYIDRTVKEMKRQSADPSKFNESSARARVEDIIDTIDEIRH